MAGSAHSRLRAAVLLLTAVIMVMALSLICGSFLATPAQVLQVLAGGGDPLSRTLILELRLPRLLNALGVGGLLALTGVSLQALFRNPLADPYILGVSGGAAFGAICALAAGLAAVAVQGAAAAGAVLALVLVWAIARGAGATRVLLTGVVVASVCGALVTLILTTAEESRVRSMVFWLAGDLSWDSHPALALGAALLAVAGAVLLARPLNVLAAGDLRARSVGLEVSAWRALVYGIAAVLTAIAVVSAGTIGFVGLITPHFARLLFRTHDHRIVAPAAAVLGGTLLALADLAARTVAAPRQLPVGAIMAVAGTPLFLLLLRQARGR
ncbi:MAG TPA: iron ABC transporter permease [Steroidobacteraceae bacterium]|nr:iron ABC transporter permease [Steroidobacteraceae bacterium]